MTEPVIAWVDEPAPDGHWGLPQELGVPLNDRGLLLADGLFETVLVCDGRPRLLADHLERWRQGAVLLGMEAPPAAQQLEPLIREAMERSGIRQGALRLNWSRGSAAGAVRGIGLSNPCRHRFWLQLTATAPCFAPLRVIVSATEERSSSSLLSRCKTFAYGPAIQARRQAEAAGADDALLASSAGGLCCGTTANLLVRLEGHWLTPPLESGCLPGVMRARALTLGLAREARQSQLDEAALAASSGALLLNSLSCRPITHLAGSALTWSARQPASPQPSPEHSVAEQLWRRLLD